MTQRGKEILNVRWIKGGNGMMEDWNAGKLEARRKNVLVQPGAI
jgi:hypothetical protein